MSAATQAPPGSDPSASTRPTARDAKPQGYGPPRIRVSIIEDDAHQLDLLALITARRRPTWVIAAVLGDEGWLDGLREDPGRALGQTDLMLVDSHLGRMTALGLLPHLRDHGPVVILCGTRNSLDERSCREAGARAMVAKPYDLAEADRLFAVCDRILAGDAS